MFTLLKLFSLVLLLLIPFGVNSFEEELLMPFDYICTGEAATGFSYDNDEWNIREFSVTNRKYLVRLLRENEKQGHLEDSTAGVFLLGESYPMIGCIYRSDGKIICKSGKFGEMYISTKNERFIQSYPIGYWLPGKYNQNSPNIMRGTCKKVE